MRRGYLPGPARFLQGEKYQFLVWRAASRCWKQEDLRLPTQRAPASPQSSPSPAGVAVSRCRSQMPGLVGLILGWDHAALMEVRDSWARSSTRAWFSLEREEELGKGTAAIGSYPQQMETYHTLCYSRPAPPFGIRLVGFSSLCVFGSLIDVLPRRCSPATHSQWGWCQGASSSGSLEPLRRALGKQNKTQALPALLAQQPRSALLPLTPPYGST